VSTFSDKKIANFEFSIINPNVHVTDKKLTTPRLYVAGKNELSATLDDHAILRLLQETNRLKHEWINGNATAILAEFAR